MSLLRTAVRSCLLLSCFSVGILGQMSAIHPLAQVEPAKGEPVADFVDIAQAAGLTARSTLSRNPEQEHINELTGGGVALLDYDKDGWLDIFLLTGAGSHQPGSGAPSSNLLYHNNHDGTFTDVTAKAGLTRSGWGQGASVGDYNGDGWPDLFVTFYGRNVLYRNNGDGTFTDVTKAAGLLTPEDRYSTGSAFVDYDRDGYLDLFVAHYVAYGEATAHDAARGDSCKWLRLDVLCGPRGLKGETDTLYRNRGDGTFEDVSRKTGITNDLNYGFTPLVLDYNNDGWPDIYVANDSTPSLLYRNNRNGTFSEVGVLGGVAYNDEGREQSGMGTDAADIDGDGWLDLVKTNFEQDTSSLYRNHGGQSFDDVTFPSGLAVNTSFVGWGTGFLDFDSDGWPDIFMANGHIYPQVGAVPGSSFSQRKILYHNKGDGTFEDVSLRAGSGVLLKRASRGVALGDLFNRGQTDVVVNNLGAAPSLLCNRSRLSNHALTLRLIGKAPNQLAIGARATVTAGGHLMVGEVRSGGSFLSQNDLRLRFGLGKNPKADRIEVRWPDGHTDIFTNVAGGAIVALQYGGEVISSAPYQSLPARLHVAQ